MTKLKVLLPHNVLSLEIFFSSSLAIYKSKYLRKYYAPSLNNDGKIVIKGKLRFLKTINLVLTELNFLCCWLIQNKMYLEAIKEEVAVLKENGKKVHTLDIGTGTGLLAMLSVESGADQATACEVCCVLF